MGKAFISQIELFHLARNCANTRKVSGRPTASNSTGLSGGLSDEKSSGDLTISLEQGRIVQIMPAMTLLAALLDTPEERTRKRVRDIAAGWIAVVVLVHLACAIVAMETWLSPDQGKHYDKSL